MSSSVVLIVDDDDASRVQLAQELDEMEFHVVAFATTVEFFEYYDPARPGCLVLKNRLPGISGLELYAQVQELGGEHPFVIVAVEPTVPQAVYAMRAGAVNYMEMPAARDELQSSLREAIDLDLDYREERARRLHVRERIASLSPRERQVMWLVVSGMISKEIARELNISPKTVEVHRSNVVRKMNTSTVAQLVRVVTLYGEQDRRSSGSTVHGAPHFLSKYTRLSPN